MNMDKIDPPTNVFDLHYMESLEIGCNPHESIFR